ncbi:MAG: AbgT family transporter [Anaerolineales bacterium]|nr:AbgT family transporter [Anaerolineales bacterium]MDW8226608.1 hypothetical protein [Anaerolineales bacterium]
MSQEKSGVQISQKAFFQAVAIIFALMLFAGVLTRIVPAGQYTRIQVEGRMEVIDPSSFTLTERPNYPIWRWFTAPFEIFVAEGNTTVIGIILFIVLVGVAFAVMDRSGILTYAIQRIVQRFSHRKYLLMLVLTFFFMSLGGFFGILEEVVPLVPIIIALSYSLGWDSLTGLGISILATNVGFSTAVFNFFTIGTAQRLAGLPLFSGWGPRLVLFFVAYVILSIFLVSYAKRIERQPEKSPVYPEDQPERAKYKTFKLEASVNRLQMNRALIFMAVFFVLILAAVMTLSWIESLNDLAMPLSGLLFVIGGLGAALLAGIGKDIWKAMRDGFLGMAPAIPLLMMAASVRHIVASGGILDTILHWASNLFSNTTPFVSSLVIYALTLILELFITSGSAKALLVIPILMPLADIVHVNRQIAISAYCFGDGFSNLVYPTNALLLITLSLTVVPYHKWLRWVLRLWPWIILATVIFLAIAVSTNYGPF